MAMLKNENQQLPGGFSYHEPKTNFCPQPFSSIDSIVQQLLAHRKGRPDLMAATNWSLDPAVIRQQVINYNVAKAVQMGWRDYLVGDENSLPFPSRSQASPLSKLRNVAGGSVVLVEWRVEGAPTIPQEQANKRAEICSTCPMNGQGGWESYFTVPVSNAIRREIEIKKSMKLETPFDEQIETCEGCTCPLPLKVWMPISNITAKMPESQRAALDPRCWILQESK